MADYKRDPYHYSWSRLPYSDRWVAGFALLGPEDSLNEVNSCTLGRLGVFALSEVR